MNIREGLDRRISLGWLLFGVILAPAVAIVVWLTILKAPPGNAVLIGDAPPRSEAVGTGGVKQDSAPTSETRLFAQGTQGAVSAKTVSGSVSKTTLATTAPIPAQIVSLPSPTIDTITVYVSGAVIKPGIYSLTAGSRMADAINAAGGVTVDADTETINLAARIADEDHILVPQRGATSIAATETPLHPASKQTPQVTREAVAPGRSPTIGPQDKSQQKIDVNRATASELETIPGVGPVLAARIIAYRDAHGPFASVEDLVAVPGIKEGILSKLRNFITAIP